MKLKYSKAVMKHFTHPKNMGEIKNADAVGQAGNPVCGDIMKIYIKVKDNKIKDIKFKTLGCAAAIASSDMLTELARGKTLEGAAKLTGADVVKKLGKLPPVKVHCSVLAQHALRDAIKKYWAKHK
jgi:nitrogen fixation NifU-like protein